MKRKYWTVTKASTRPAVGRPDHCYHCNEPIGSQHKPECVIRSKTVVVDFTVQVVLSVPEHLDEHGINQYYNESGWCADNLLLYLQNRQQEFYDNSQNGCICHLTIARYIREADEQDEKKYGVMFIEKCES